MEYINLDDEASFLNNDNINLENKQKIKKEFTLSNPIFTEMINFTVLKDDVEYEFNICYKNEKWKIIRKLSQIQNLIKSLQNLNFVFFNENYFKNLKINNNDKSLNIKEININILNFLRYINYRFDILSNVITKDFFSFNECQDPEVLTNSITKDNLDQIHNFKVEESDMTLSDFIYDSELGLLILGFEDISFLSSVGRFWSLIDYEILGNCFIYQRVFDKENRPYFRKAIGKSFDSRVSKLEISLNLGKIFVGIDNGIIQIFNINMLDRNFYKKSTDENNNNENNNNESPHNEDKFLVITEGNNFKYLNDRITGLQTYLDFLFVVSKENKILILDVIQSIPEIKFNGSLKRRIEGKGSISNIKIDSQLKKLFISTVTDKILIYDICTTNKFSNQETKLDIKIEYFNEINCLSNIKNIFIKGLSLFVALEDKIQIFNLNNSQSNFDSNLICLDGSLDETISYSSKFIKIDYKNYISSISFFTDMKLIILGLINGTLVAINSRSLEIIYARKITTHPIIKLVLLEENYIVIASDEKGNIFFFKLGI